MAAGGELIELGAGKAPLRGDQLGADALWHQALGVAPRHVLAEGVTTRKHLAKKLGLRPLARIHTTTVVSSDPLYMLTGIIPTTEKVLRRAGLTLADIDLFEVNEAFAPVVLAWAHETGVDLAKTNVNGGAIAIGHPLGASGARMMTTLVNALHQRGGRYGLQTMCEGGGMANATIIERGRSSQQSDIPQAVIVDGP